MFTLPSLPFDYSALEPFIDTQTMQIHHDKHHQAYVDNLNKALENHPELKEKSVEDLLTNLESLPEDIRTKVRNNGGGHFNHSMFWQILAKPESITIEQFNNFSITQKIIAQWGSMEKFKEEFTKVALGRFGSGWVWLVNSKNETEDSRNKETLKIIDLPNQDNPLMPTSLTACLPAGKALPFSLTPLLGLDVWEHAYYLKYQNRRKDYVDAFWNVLNWEEVEKRFRLVF